MAHGMTWRVMAWYMVWPGKLEVLLTRSGPVHKYSLVSKVITLPKVSKVFSPFS